MNKEKQDIWQNLKEEGQLGILRRVLHQVRDPATEALKSR